LFKKFREGCWVTVAEVTKLYFDLLPLEWTKVLDLRVALASVLHNDLFKTSQDKSDNVLSSADWSCVIEPRTDTFHLPDLFIDVIDQFQPEWLTHGKLDNDAVLAGIEEEWIYEWHRHVVSTSQGRTFSNDRLYWKRQRRCLWQKIVLISPILAESLANALDN
jgi:hypothetical protein